MFRGEDPDAASQLVRWEERLRAVEALASYTRESRSVRADTGSIPATLVVNTAITFPVAMTDDDYTVVATILDADDPGLRVLRVASKSATGVVVTIVNDDPALARQGDIHVIAIHD